ncbi:hypothetical protein A6302_04191 [Methylobrevis pamukkalensis]|uniref:Uncharacterized protein n=1 Tax=Methylobrevis pamukkalensis TaxID=1439726 RepID=A0A1E3GWX5_9HYPH|nr:hypothetical protein A6302_04191 [Methylobrevis pamukkalensis]
MLIRDGMARKNVAAIGQTVLFRRIRTLLVRPHGNGLIATTLNYDYEVVSETEAFDDIPATKIEGEMLDLAGHIIKTKKGKFDPKTFDDRYDAALAELVKAKLEGRKIEVRKEPEPGKVVSLLEALRESAGSKSSKAKAGKAKASKAKGASPAKRKSASAGKTADATKAAPRRKAG